MAIQEQNPANYVIAMLNMEKENEPRFQILDTGKRYHREDAIAKAKKMNETMKEELKVLDYDSFVAYNSDSE